MLLDAPADVPIVARLMEAVGGCEHRTIDRWSLSEARVTSAEKVAASLISRPNTK